MLVELQKGDSLAFFLGWCPRLASHVLRLHGLLLLLTFFQCHFTQFGKKYTRLFVVQQKTHYS